MSVPVSRVSVCVFVFSFVARGIFALVPLCAMCVLRAHMRVQCAVRVLIMYVYYSMYIQYICAEAQHTVHSVARKLLLLQHAPDRAKNATQAAVGTRAVARAHCY